MEYDFISSTTFYKNCYAFFPDSIYETKQIKYNNKI